MKRAYTQINIAVFLWGFTGILGKAIDLTAPILVWWRMLLATLFLFLILYFTKGFVRIRGRALTTLIGVGILFAIHWVLFYYAVKWANASIAMVCMATSSVTTSILDPLIRKRPIIFSEFLLGLLAVFGVLCIYLWPAEITDDTMQMVNFEWGLIMGIIAAVISALFSIFNKPLAEKYPAQPLVFLEMLSGVAFLTVFLLVSGSSFLGETGWVPTSMDWLWLLILAFFCTVIPQILAMASLKKLSAFTATLSVNLEPVYGILFAFLIFQENEQLGPGFYIGISLIFFSLLGQILNSTRKSRMSTPKDPHKPHYS